MAAVLNNNTLIAYNREHLIGRSVPYLYTCTVALWVMSKRGGREVVYEMVPKLK